MERSKSPISKLTPLNIQRYIRDKSPVKSPGMMKPKKSMKNLQKSMKNLSKMYKNQDLTAYAGYGLDEKTLKTYKLIFNMFDSDRNQTLTPTDLRNMFNYIGIYTNRNEIFKVLCDYDLKENGYLDFDDFLKVITDRIKPFENEKKRMKKMVFNQISDKKAVLGIEDLEKAFFKYGFQVEKEEITEIYTMLLRRAEAEDGELNFDNFDQVLLEINQELKKELQENKF